MALGHHGTMAGRCICRYTVISSQGCFTAVSAASPQQPEVTRAEQQFCFRSQVSCLLSPAARETLLLPAA